MTVAPMDGRRCTATSKRSGERCKRLAMRGQRVCAMHGGKTPAALHAARVRLIDEDAQKVVERLEGSPITDVVELYEHLQALGGRCVALTEILTEQAAELSSWTGTDAFGHEDVRALLAAYERSLDRTTRFLTSLARLDLEGRLMRLREEQAKTLKAGHDRALARTSLSEDQRREVRAAFAAELWPGCPAPPTEPCTGFVSEGGVADTPRRPALDASSEAVE